MSHPITLALVAHNRYKEMLAYFVLDHRAAFSRFHLVATRDTGRTVQKWTGLKVHLLQHGPEGGEEQLGVLAAANEVQAVIFFRDPLVRAADDGRWTTDDGSSDTGSSDASSIVHRPSSAEGREPDFTDLLQVCDLREIPAATNRATAEALLFFLLHSPDRALVTARPWGFVHPPLEAEQGGSENITPFKKGA